MVKVFSGDASIGYFGRWKKDSGFFSTSSFYSKAHFTFYGDRVKVWVLTGKNQGVCEIALDGRYEAGADCFSETGGEACVFDKSGISGEYIHNLTVTLVPGIYESSPGPLLTIAAFEAPRPADYPAELKRMMNAEYAVIQGGMKTWKSPGEWKPVAYRALMPKHGVILLPGLIRDMYDRNIANIKFNAALPDYCEGEPPFFLEGDDKNHPGWSGWLPASNEGRMLAGAAGALRWEDDPELRQIVDKIIGGIKGRMRDDGYFNYYSEESSYLMEHTKDEMLNEDRTGETFKHAVYSERKNYDRVFWTRGMLEAIDAGNPDAPLLLRRMYDWFNRQDKYLARILLGANATNGDPGGPMVYHTEIGKPEDIITNQRYYDQDYWMEAFVQRQALAFAFYPGERPHSTALLPLQAMADEYSATGDIKYRDALFGAWDVYHDKYKHAGGPTAICEAEGPYPPETYYITTGHNGENCGSIYWLWINQRLMQLFPEEEKYIAEIEEVVYNTLMNCISGTNYRYHTRLHGKKDVAENVSSCCQVSATIAISTLPQYIYTESGEGVNINLFIPSVFHSAFADIAMKTAFPESGDVSIAVEPKPGADRFTVSVRIPGWAQRETALFINGVFAKSGKAGERIALNRKWKKGDTLSFTIPYGFNLVLYTGTDQAPDNKPRYTLLYGPVLMALEAPCVKADDIPHIRMTPDQLIASLKSEKDKPLHFKAPGAGYTYMPYWDAKEEGFTCVPVICE